MTPFLFILLIQLIILNCFEQAVENCAKFDEINHDRCAKCEDNHFLFYNNLYCLPCDDVNYGQIGCGGNCDSSKYENDRFVYCNKNECKEGYYNLEGICFSCNKGSPGCKKCNVTEKIENGLVDYNYICEECLDNEYRLNKFGTCEKCKMDHCLKCQFTDDYTNKVCLECESDYYLSSNKTCNRCHHDIYNGGGYCTVCSDNQTDLLSAENCYCYSDYFLNENNTCSNCGRGCSRCISKEDKTPYCLECSSGTFIKENVCLTCPGGCSKCILDDNNQTICTSCYSNYILLNGLCKYCGNGCNNCIIKENEKISCLSCSYNYAFNPNETCAFCRSIGYIGGSGCERCRYNNLNNKYECIQCYQYYSNNKYIQDYSYIKNKFQCLNNRDPSQFYLYGCLEANFIEDNKYECLKCDEGFIPIINDKTCRNASEISLSNNCLEGINIGNESDPIYSCNKCSNENAIISNSKNINDCFNRVDSLIYCLKGEVDTEGNNICTECVPLAHLNGSHFCECNSDSFGVRNLFCYKCDDENRGNTGCIASEGCIYKISNDQLNCNKCKSNYFEFTKGQCFACAKEIEFCNKCKVDEDDKFICEDCVDNFIYNKYEEKCELNCQEYSDISPGCIICNEEYKSKRKCNACKQGYFKTENETCEYCRSEKNGGPACNKCIQNKSSENIICDKCIGKYNALNSKGKCYNCQHDLFNECEHCKFIFEGKNEKLVCTFCKLGYYLDSFGNCVSYEKYLEKMPNCYGNSYKIGNLTIYYYSYNSLYFEFYYNNSYYYSSSSILDNDENIRDLINENLKKINNTIKGICIDCNDDFYLKENKCEPFKIENCSIISMIKNNLYYYCRDFCRYKQYPLIVLDLNNTGNEPSYITISEIYEKYRYSTKLSKLKISLLNQTLCIDNSDNSENNNLKNCAIALYLEQENKYICNICQKGYFLYGENKQCIKFDENPNCVYENIGNETNPIFSCIKCPPNNNYNYDYYYNRYFYEYKYNDTFYYYNLNDDYSSNYILAKEGNINSCVYRESEIENCLSVDVNTTYVKNKYNCTSCLINHLPYNSEFYERKICQNIFENIKNFQDTDLDVYYYYNRIEAIEGECPNNTFFTPDDKYCYKCNDIYIGMVGCKSQCSFSIERNNMIKCLDGCKDGYIESSEGICESCNSINSGCNKCHYENDYPKNYLGIKRKRKFICDECRSNYYVKNDDKCVYCDNIEGGCNLCHYEGKEFKCNKCYSNYLLDNKGHCNYCGGFIFDNKCIQCNDINQGGIEGCQYCHIYENKTSCYSCNEGYILLRDNETCLKIAENEELKKHINCREITLENNKFHCLECKDYKFSILKENNESICIYLPELNGYVDNDYYYDSEYLYKYENKPDIDYIYKYYFNQYLQYYFYHCIEVINLGSKDNPLFSCTKCYSSTYLLTDNSTNISYCIYYYNVDNYDDMQNCIEKKIIMEAKGIKFTCIKCLSHYTLAYHKIDKVNYCKYVEIDSTDIIDSDTGIDLNDTADFNDITNTSEKETTTIKLCMAKKCKICKSDDEYVCEVCELDDYEVNDISGACVKKVIPAITWKDIFRLEMNSQKEIKGKIISGPKLHLRGITNSQINTGHAFIIYLIFKIKQPLNLRNLEDDTIRIKAICEAINEVEENKNEENSVEYECIGDNSNNTDLTNSVLENIDVEDDNNSNLKNLKNFVSTKDLSKLESVPTIQFIMDKIQNQTSNNYSFDFRIDGKIDDNLNETEINENLEMNEIDKPSNCTLIIEKDKNANLNCKLNIEDYKNITLITFKTTKISNGDEYNIDLVDFNKIYLINKNDDSKNETIFNDLYKKKEEKKSNVGVIVGSIVAVLAFVIVALITTYLCFKRKNKNTVLESQNNPDITGHIHSKTSDNLNND